VSERITLAAALQLISAAHEEAQRRGAKVSVAVVDTGGNLLAFGRMDGAEIAGPTLAVDKAFTSVAQSISTQKLGELAAPGGELFGLQANGAGRYVIFGGGIPLVRSEIIVGAVGVSGSSVANDVACAEQAVRVFDTMV
jgi:uncharacterized protein GlcG (DUF336 family)